MAIGKVLPLLLALAHVLLKPVRAIERRRNLRADLAACKKELALAREEITACHEQLRIERQAAQGMDELLRDRTFDNTCLREERTQVHREKEQALVSLGTLQSLHEAALASVDELTIANEGLRENLGTARARIAQLETDGAALRKKLRQRAKSPIRAAIDSMKRKRTSRFP